MSGSDETACRDTDTSRNRGPQERERWQRPHRGWGGRDLCRPCCSVPGGEGTGKQTQHKESSAPKPLAMELRESPRRKGGQKLVTEPQSIVSKTRPSSNTGREELGVVWCEGKAVPCAGNMFPLIDPSRDLCVHRWISDGAWAARGVLC